MHLMFHGVGGFIGGVVGFLILGGSLSAWAAVAVGAVAGIIVGELVKDVSKQS
jgi:outer membrane lipoprotein SlyB